MQKSSDRTEKGEELKPWVKRKDLDDKCEEGMMKVPSTLAQTAPTSLAADVFDDLFQQYENKEKVCMKEGSFSHENPMYKVFPFIFFLSLLHEQMQS
jgi:hypothetical protein